MLIRSPKCLFCLLLLCAFACLSSSDKEEHSSEDPPSYLLRNILMCLRREYTLKAIRSDQYGNTCWDFIRSTSCWGRCDSFEVNIISLNTKIKVFRKDANGNLNTLVTGAQETFENQYLISYHYL